MEDSQDETELLNKREARRQRRQEKKLLKQDRKEREKEMKTLALKFGPRDTRVTIVTKEFAEKLAHGNKTIDPALTRNAAEIGDENFPRLGENSSRTERIAESLSQVEITQTESQKRSRSAIMVNLSEMISSLGTKPIVKLAKPQTVKAYEGNILDASHPERKRGKHREVPKKKKLSKIKSSMVKEEDGGIDFKTRPGSHSVSFQIYCDNCVTQELNHATTKLLKEIVNFQEKLYQRDPIKAVSKRRYVLGLHEVKKFLKVDKLRIILIAPNINITVEDGILNNVISDIKELAVANETPYVFALTRRKMGRICLKTVPVSCVGVLDISGAEDSFNYVLDLIQVTRTTYAKTLPVKTGKDDVIEELKVKIFEALK